MHSARGARAGTQRSRCARGSRRTRCVSALLRQLVLRRLALLMRSSCRRARKVILSVWTARDCRKSSVDRCVAPFLVPQRAQPSDSRPRRSSCAESACSSPSLSAHSSPSLPPGPACYRPPFLPPGASDPPPRLQPESALAASPRCTTAGAATRASSSLLLGARGSGRTARRGSSTSRRQEEVRARSTSMPSLSRSTVRRDSSLWLLSRTSS